MLLSTVSATLWLKMEHLAPATCRRAQWGQGILWCYTFDLTKYATSLSLSLYIYIYIFVGFCNFKQCYTSQFFIFFNVNFDKSTGVIYFLFIPPMLANFQNDQKISNYVIYQNFNFKFFISKLCIKNEFMDRIINNI